MHRWAEGVPTAADRGPLQEPDRFSASPQFLLTAAGVSADLLFVVQRPFLCFAE